MSWSASRRSRWAWDLTHAWALFAACMHASSNWGLLMS